jgi:hypothetical protein
VLTRRTLRNWAALGGVLQRNDPVPSMEIFRGREASWCAIARSRANSTVTRPCQRRAFRAVLPDAV